MPLVAVDQKAPNFKLADQQGREHSLSSFAGRPVVLYFYPKDDTSGCTDQACQFRDAAPDFAALNAAVLGISPDNVASHARFVAKHALNFTLLADEPQGATPPVCDTYGVWAEKSMYGRKYMGVVRTTYLIDANGIVKARWDAVKVPGHIDQVAQALRALVNGDPIAAAEPAAKKAPKKAPIAKRVAKALSKIVKRGTKKATAKPAKKATKKATSKVTKKAAKRRA